MTLSGTIPNVISSRMHPDAVLDRLRQLSRLADLDPARRLDLKVDYSPRSVERRLRQQSMLRSACVRLRQSAASR